MTAVRKVEVMGAGAAKTSVPSATSQEKGSFAAEGVLVADAGNTTSKVAGAKITNSTNTTAVNLYSKVGNTIRNSRSRNQAEDGIEYSASDFDDSFRGGSSPRLFDPKEDKVALLRYVTRTTDSTSGKVRFVDLLPPYSRFFIQGIGHTRNENVQIQINNEDFNVYAFGETPRVETVSGILLNTKNHKWRTEFRVLYDNFLRATKCAEINAEVLLAYDERVVRGALLSVSERTDAVSPYAVPLTFTMVIFKEYDQYAEENLSKLQTFLNTIKKNKSIELTSTQVENLNKSIAAMSEESQTFASIQSSMLKIRVRNKTVPVQKETT